MTAVALVFADGWIVAEHGAIPIRALHQLGEVGVLDEAGVPENAHGPNVERALSGTEAPYSADSLTSGTPGAREGAGGPELPSDDARELRRVPDLDREPLVEFLPSRRPTAEERAIAAQHLERARARLDQAKKPWTGVMRARGASRLSDTHADDVAGIACSGWGDVLDPSSGGDICSLRSGSRRRESPVEEAPGRGPAALREAPEHPHDRLCGDVDGEPGGASVFDALEAPLPVCGLGFPGLFAGAAGGVVHPAVGLALSGDPDWGHLRLRHVNIKSRVGSYVNTKYQGASGAD